jgi:pyruvate dehydrogenase E2 component (dihydrolipoamide acetyltransferase)
MQDEGYIAKILYPDGSKDIAVGQPICIIVDDQEDVGAFKDFTLSDLGSVPSAQDASADASTAPQATGSAPVAASSPSTSAASSGDRVVASPYAHKVASEAGIPLNGIQGTGPNGRILADDVLEAKSAPAKSAAPSKPAAASPQSLGLSQFEDTSVSSIRKVIAERLTFSKSNIPHYYVTVAVQVDDLLKMRARLNQHSSSKISVNDMVIKASALASMQVPETNSSWMDSHIRTYKNVDMSVAI